MLDLLTSFYEIIAGLGSHLLLPVFFFVIALIAQQGVRRAMQSSLAIMGSMVALQLLLNYLSAQLNLITESMIREYGFANVSQNVSWKLASSITFTSDIVYYVLPAFVLINAVLVILQSTRVVNLDLWSFWQIGFIGALVEHLTQNFWYGLACALMAGVLQLVIADVFSQSVSSLADTRNITVTQSFALGFAPVAWLVNFLIDRIPPLRERYLRFENSRDRNSLFNEPSLWGLLIGAGLGFISGLPLYEVSNFALIVAGCLFAVPRLLRVLARAVTSITEPLAARTKILGSLPLQFAVTPLTALSNAAVLLIAIIMVPITVVLSNYLPGNVVLPQGDITMLLYGMIFVVALSRECIIRSIITGILSVIGMLYCGTALTQLFTQTAALADPAAYGTGLYNTLCNVANPITYLYVQGSSFGLAGVCALGVITLAAVFLSSHHNRRKARELPSNAPRKAAPKR